jgi:hypothetical protein
MTSDRPWSVSVDRVEPDDHACEYLAKPSTFECPLLRDQRP